MMLLHQHLQSLLYIKIYKNAPEVVQGVDMKSREQTTLQSELPKSLPNSSVTHAVLLEPVSSHQQDLRLRKTCLFPPPLLPLNLVS